MEHINIFEVSNIRTTLKYLKTKNFWISGFDKKKEINERIIKKKQSHCT